TIVFRLARTAYDPDQRAIHRTETLERAPFALQPFAPRGNAAVLLLQPQFLQHIGDLVLRWCQRLAHDRKFNWAAKVHSRAGEGLGGSRIRSSFLRPHPGRVLSL